MKRAKAQPRGMRRSHWGLRASCLVATAALICASNAWAAGPAWPHSGSDLKPDPGLTFGALANGMRYELLKNVYPPGRVSLRLRMAVGARDELAEEAGFAHFLEHMAFRGSTHFADGEIMKRLASFGVRTGSDANASTSGVTTVFRIDLPDNHADSIALAFEILRDIADRLNIDAEAVDSERKVVLSEARLTDTPGWRLGQRKSEFMLSTLGRSEHSAIGTPQTINAATAAQLRAFYGRFYRPERATLIVVGDTDLHELAAAIDKAFSGWQGRGEAPAPAPRDPRALNTPDVHVEFDPRMGNHADLVWITSVEGLPDSEARERNDLVLDVGMTVLNRRYNTLAEGTMPPFLDAGIHRSPWAPETYLTGMTADSTGGKWREALITAEAVRRGVLAAGVSQKEVDAVTPRVITGYQGAVDAIANRPSAFLANGLLQDLDRNRVSQDPAERLQRVLAVLKPLQAKTVDEALRAEFQDRTPAAWLTTTFPVPGGDAELREAVLAAESVRPRTVPVRTVTAWPYRSFGAPGKVVYKLYDAKIDATKLEFGNGVRLNIKKTSFAKEQIEVNVSIGHGYGDLPPDQPPFAWAILNVFVRGGLRVMDYDTMQALLADKRYGVAFLMSETAFNLLGSTRDSDLDTQLQVLAAYCTAPAFRPAVFEQSRNAHLELISSWQSEPYRELMMTIPGLLRSNDRRWMLPSADDLRSARLADFRRLLTIELEQAPIEITIVGDVDVDKAIQKVANTFGALKPRSRAKLAYVPDGSFPQASTKPIVVYHQGREDQGAAAIAWPAVDMLSDGRRFYALTMLAEIMNTRLSERLRPVLGKSYASNVASSLSENGPQSTSAIVALADVSPQVSQEFFDEVLKLAAEMRSTPVSPEEFDRAQKPRVARLEASIPTNAFWAHWLDLSQRDPRRSAFAQNALMYLKSVTPRDIQDVANTYLRDEASWRVVFQSEQGRSNGGESSVVTRGAFQIGTRAWFSHWARVSDTFDHALQRSADDR
jgi:zinc protease